MKHKVNSCRVCIVCGRVLADLNRNRKCFYHGGFVCEVVGRVVDKLPGGFHVVDGELDSGGILRTLEWTRGK